MRRVTIATLALLLSLAGLGVGILIAQDEPQPATATAEHRWLAQLVGTWEVTSSATMAPGAPPMEFTSTERVRSLGGLWVVAEGEAEIGGMAMSSLMTVGFDPGKKQFVGTWVDSVQTHLWHYRGSLDAEGKTLSMLAEGPSFTDPTKTAMYRDAITIVSPDHKRLTSSVQGPDGGWIQFMEADYRRKKAEKAGKAAQTQ